MIRLFTNRIFNLPKILFLVLLLIGITNLYFSFILLCSFTFLSLQRESKLNWGFQSGPKGDIVGYSQEKVLGGNTHTVQIN